MNQLKKLHEKLNAIENKEWYTLRSILGNTWAIFFILLGGREAGKSYSVTEQFVKDWRKHKRPFTWLRLTEASRNKLLQNNAEKLIDADIRRKYKLEDITVKGGNVYEGKNLMARVLALSTFYNDKGSALFDKDFDLGYNICLDEMNREKNEKKSFDIVYAFVNQIENLVRSTKDNMRIFLIGNTLDEAGDLLTCFNFVPETFGRFKVKKKRAVIDYMKPTQAYLNRRKGTVADLLTPTASTFTNKIDIDKSMIDKRRLTKINYIIKFSKEKENWYCVWNNNVIKRYNNDTCKKVISMRPYLDEIFATEQRDAVFTLYDAKAYSYRDLITQKLFKKDLELLKARK